MKREKVKQGDTIIKKETIIIWDKVVFVEKKRSVNSENEISYWIVIGTITQEFIFMYTSEEERNRKYDELISNIKIFSQAYASSDSVIRRKIGSLG